MDEKRYCGHCRQEVGSGARRCPHCGGDLPARDGDTVGDSPTVHPAGEEPTPSWSEGMVVADRFRIVRCIGQGGMGLVYLAHDQSLDRPIALKRVPQEILFDGDARDDLRQEAIRLLDLAHENIIRVHTYYDERAWPFFAMEYLQGPTLKELLRARKLEGTALTAAEVLVVARQVERGLSYAHSKGIVHRDLKPGNLMFASQPGKPLSDRDVIKITDFGISRVVADSTMRQTGKRSGTLPYMSPEQFTGEAASVQSDVYSLAATYYELLSGKPPFHTGDIGYQIVHIPPRGLQNVPRHMRAAIQRGLQKNPRHRPASVKELTSSMEGEAPRSMRLAMRRNPQLIKKIALPVGALAAALLILWGVFSRDTPMGGENENTAFAPNRTPGPEALKLGSSGALARMAREIQSQLDDLGLRSAINRTPFRFTLRKRGDLSTDVLKRVQFLLLDPAGGERRVLGSEPQKDGKPVVDALEFEIPDAPEGDYVLRAVLHEGQFPKGAPVDRPFRVDLTGPSFELGAVNREELIALDPEWFVTYNEETELQFSTPLNPGDIRSAYYQIYADSLKRFGGDKQKIADPARWRVTLVPGQNRFQVVAADDLGNESARVVRVDRLKLEVVKFEVDRMAGGVVGNRAAVRGELILERLAGPPLEGERRFRVPALAYLVNERLVVPEESSEPTAESPVFKARLFLPRHTNTIELRYQWGDDSLRRFAVANAARLAQEVPAPQVDLVPLPAQTSKTSLEVAGRVSPYFDGLEVHLLHEPLGSYRLPLRPALGAAEFSEVRHLLENKVNRFTVTCTYEGQALAPGGPSVEVYCDINPPRLLDPVEFRPKGEFLQLVVVPSEEPLLSLQMKTPDGEWRQIASRNDGRYAALVHMPREKTEFLFKMVDLAGNESVVKQVCPVFDPSLLAGGPEIQGRKAGAGREEEGRPVRSSHRLIQRSEMLKKLELEFLSCASLEREEMGTTEVNQKAWNAFLRDRLRHKVPEGDPRLPMTIGEKFDPSYLHFFALWLTEKSDDGYQYRVPTASQWILAFTGSDEAKEATESLKRWFKGPQRRFNPSPRKPYGVDDVLPIGQRPENRTPTGLLDMEANVQEIVTDENGFWHVIGGYNLFRGEDDLLYGCSEKRLYSTATETWAGKFTGFRLLRKPQKPE